MARNILVQIIADASKFTAGLNTAQAGASRFGTVMQGVGMGIGIGFANLAATGISKVVDFLGDAVRAGMEEEASIAKLTTSLRANVAGWDGNTMAIEKTIKAQMDLGFSDEEQRDSLARLVVATHDVSKAQEIQRAAMDLARLKGVDLATATDALIKVEAGQYRGLKALGIELRAGATSQEALNAVQLAAQGQAQAYADTVGGELLTAQVKFSDAMDRIGVTILPVVNAALEASVTVLDQVTGGIDAAADSSLSWDQRLKGLTDVVDIFNPMAWGFKAATDGMAGSSEGAGLSASEMARRIVASGQDMDKAMRSSATISDETAARMKWNNDDVKLGYAALAGYLMGQYNADYRTAADIADARSRLSADNVEAANLRKQVSSGSLTAAEVADANTRLAAIARTEAESYAVLAANHALSAADYDKWAAAVKLAFAGTDAQSAATRAKILADIAALRASTLAAINYRIVYTSSGSGTVYGNDGTVSTFSIGRASGGSASGLTWVGERGPELVDLPTGSYVHDNAASMSMARNARKPGGGGGGWGGGGDVHFHISGTVIDGPALDRFTNDIAQRLRYSTGV